MGPPDLQRAADAGVSAGEVRPLRYGEHVHGHRRDGAGNRGADRGAVENMEGAAVAHVAHLHGVPVGEVRGISNIVTNRDTSQWKLKNAADLAQEALLAWIARR
jgi:futalosine hydrolase